MAEHLLYAAHNENMQESVERSNYACCQINTTNQDVS